MNMVKGIATAAVLAVGAWTGTGCSGSEVDAANASGGNVITGKIENGAGAKVELRDLRGNAFVTVAETTVGPDGTFTLQPESGLPYDYHQVMFNERHPLVIIMDSTMAVHVEARLPEMGYVQGAQITGSQFSQDLAKYYEKALPLQDSIRAITARLQAEGDPEGLIAMRAGEFQMRADQWSKEFIELHPGSDAILGALEHLNPAVHQSTFKEVITATQQSLGHTAYHQAIYGELQRQVNARNVPTARTQPAGGLSIGATAPDIVMNNRDGKPIKLSDLRGKVVLIDFWASWCGPCRRENPTVVRAYEQFKGKGFEIFSVSLDSDRSRWLAAIQQDGLVWPNHVSDLAGWQNAAAAAYGISSIPATLLIDRQGQIVATNLRGPALAAKLAELLP
jgi:peroxiredoxin